MKRDINLIRLLLLQYEGEEPKPDLSAFNEEQQVYHSALLIEAGLVDGVIVPNQDGYPVATSVLRLTWDGHEVLDAARTDTTWHKAIDLIGKSGGNVTISLAKEILHHVIKQSLGLP